MVADAVLEVLLLAGREPRLFRFVCNFKALWDDLFLDDDLHGEVKVASVIDLNPFLNDAGVNRVFTGFDLAAKRDVEPHVNVLVGSEVNGDEVRIAAVGDGVIPSSIFRIVLSVLFDVSGVDNLPRRRPRACIARVRDSEVEEHRGVALHWPNLAQRVVLAGAVAVGDNLDENSERSVNGERDVGPEF